MKLLLIKSGTLPLGYITREDSSTEVYIDNQEASIVKKYSQSP